MVQRERRWEPEEWLPALAREGKPLGFTAVRWVKDGAVREESPAPGAARGWSLQIPLIGADFIELESVSGDSLPPFDLRGMAAIIERTCPGNSPGERRSASVGAE